MSRVQTNSIHEQFILPTLQFLLLLPHTPLPPPIAFSLTIGFKSWAKRPWLGGFCDSRFLPSHADRLTDDTSWSRECVCGGVCEGEGGIILLVTARWLLHNVVVEQDFLSGWHTGLATEHSQSCLESLLTMTTSLGKNVRRSDIDRRRQESLYHRCEAPTAVHNGRCYVQSKHAAFPPFSPSEVTSMNTSSWDQRAALSCSTGLWPLTWCLSKNGVLRHPVAYCTQVCFPHTIRDNHRFKKKKWNAKTTRGHRNTRQVLPPRHG